MNKTIKKARKGFSLVELVIAILIIAVLVAAVFAGGSIIIRNSQVSRTTSDLHNFSIAMETWMNQNPTLSNVLKTDMEGTQFKYDEAGSMVNEFNRLLSDDYKIARELALPGAEIIKGEAPATASSTDTTKLPQYVSVKAGLESRVFESKKTDAWGNPYYIVFDCEERNDGQSEFYVYVISAGPNATTEVDGVINNDDVFVLAQYTNGDVVSAIYDMNNVTNTAKDGTGAVAEKYSVSKTTGTPAVTDTTDLTKVAVNFTK